MFVEQTEHRRDSKSAARTKENTASGTITSTKCASSFME